MLHALSFVTPYLAAQAPDGGSPLTMLLPIGVMFAVVYFLMLRPQSKQQKDHSDFLATLQKGQDVVTYGGILGKIHAVSENSISLEISKDVRIQVLKSYVYAVPQVGTATAGKDSKDSTDGKTADAGKKA